MTTKQIAIKTLAVTVMTVLMASAALAHSNHDHSTVPFKWKFSKKMSEKIEKDLNSSKPSGMIGLNPFEQKKFKYYGIHVGNKFNSNIRGVEVTFERTSTGLKMVDASKVKLSTKKETLPIRNVSLISNISLKKPGHIGHNHGRLPLEWVFGDSTNSKIVKHMFQGKNNLSVGLTRLEKRLLKEYEIKIGNKFEIFISGHSFLVKRTSTGLTILNHVNRGELAKVISSEDMVENNI